MKEQIKIAAKLYEYRDTAKTFYKDKFQEQIAPFKRLITEVMKEHKIDTLPAVLKCSQLEVIEGNGMAQLLLFAAAVEIIEPSEPKTPTQF